MKPKIVYIAASYPRKDEAQSLAGLLKHRGHCVSSRWHREGPKKDNPTLWPTDCLRDLEDLEECNVLVGITGDNLSRGGRHTEIGIALATGKRIILVGPMEQVFHAHPKIEVVSSPADAVELLGRESRTWE
jgi:hypothetical protein